MIAACALMNLTAQAAYPELCLGLGRPISAVRINIRRRIGFVQKPIEFLTVMHARVGHVILPDQLVPGIGIDVVLVFGASCRPSHPHFRHGYYAAWEPEQSSHQPSGRRERCSPSLPNAGQNARTVSQ